MQNVQSGLGLCKVIFNNIKRIRIIIKYIKEVSRSMEYHYARIYTHVIKSLEHVRRSLFFSTIRYLNQQRIR